MAEARNENRTSSAARGRTDTPQQTPSQQEVSRTPPRQSGGINRYRDPFSMMSDLHREMDRLFGNFGFFGGDLDRGFGDLERNLWSPQIEMQERDNHLIIRADLPGLSKNDVRCEINNGVLTLEGERKREQHDEKGGWTERSYGRFFRSIALPDGVSADSAKASFKDGVLEITLDAPKHEESRGKQIEIS